MDLKNKKILITTGPTWVPIDKVRVISNIATGSTGIQLAEKLALLGAKVTLLLGAVKICCLNKKVRLIHFKYFEELKNLLLKELSSKKYNIVIHSAAVSDYQPKISYKQKVKSGIKDWKLYLAPTPKIINYVKKIDPCVFLVGFKFELRANKTKLIKQARCLMKSSCADLVVANRIYNGNYSAYIVNPIRNIKHKTLVSKGVNRSEVSAVIKSRNELVKKLVREIGERLCSN